MINPQEFQQLSKEEKITKILSILQILKKDIELFKDLYELVFTLQSNIEEELLSGIYNNIYYTSHNLDNLRLKKDIYQIEKIKQKLKKLKEIEENKKTNPDEILEKLENI